MIGRIFKWIFIIPIKVYQWTISPMLGQNCRYRPTCSHYMVAAIQEWGVFKGLWLGVKRIGRCHPWSTRDMEDPVPVNENRKSNT